MKTTFCLMLLLSITVLFAEVLFYDDFNRADGAVGNGWTNIGPANIVIENNSMKIVSSSFQGVRRDFVDLNITSGIYYVSYDWKIVSNDWLADAFPNGTITYLRHDYQGNLYYDNTSDFSAPISIGNLALGDWANIKWEVNLNTNRFSLWINSTLMVNNISGNVVNDFTRFTFRAGSGSSVTQYIDNFFVYDETPPAPPDNLIATGTVNDITLSWTGTTQDFLSYKIYRKTTSPADEFLAEIPGTQNSYVDNNVMANTDYFYRVKSVTMGVIESEFSTEVTAHLQPSVSVYPKTINIEVGQCFSASSEFSITNVGNYPLTYYISENSRYLTDGFRASYLLNESVDVETANKLDGTIDESELTPDGYENCNNTIVSGTFEAYDTKNQYSNNRLSYITTNPNYGIIGSFEEAVIELNVNAQFLTAGNYTDILFINSNDPETPSISLTVVINVLPPIPSINPQSFEIKINAENMTRNVSFQLENSGSGFLQYQLNGSDSFLSCNLNNYTLLGEFNNHLYYISNNTSTWAEAKDSCINAGGHLVTITSQTENNWISSQYTSQAWIGLTDEIQEGDFRWVTNEPLVFERWWPGQPDNYDGGEDYCEINYGGVGYWNDQKNDHSWDGRLIKHILEIDNISHSSILSFPKDAGSLTMHSSTQLLMYVNGANLPDGIYETSIILLTNANAPLNSLEYPVVVKVDKNPPNAPLGLFFDETQSDMNQIYLSWTANPVEENINKYKIWRRGINDSTWSLKRIVDSNQTWFIDNQFSGLDATAVYYRVSAIDWVDNESAPSNEVMAWLQRFRAPSNVQIANIANRDLQLSWSPVTQTISGLPGTPSCYVIYKSQYPSPISDFDFLGVSFEEEFTHQWALFFQPIDRLFYIVTAYGGSMTRINDLIARKQTWKYGELEQVLQQDESNYYDMKQ